MPNIRDVFNDIFISLDFASAKGNFRRNNESYNTILLVGLGPSVMVGVTRVFPSIHESLVMASRYEFVLICEIGDG